MMARQAEQMRSSAFGKERTLHTEQTQGRDWCDQLIDMRRDHRRSVLQSSYQGCEG